jgi:hypothetical protein
MEIDIPSTFNEFDAVLKEWIAGCVLSRTYNERRDEPYHREQDLVGSSRSSIDVWMEIQAIRRAEPTRKRIRIYVDYDFKQGLQGAWGVSRVRFYLRERPPKSRPASSANPRHDYAALKRDLLQGEKLLKKRVDDAHDLATSMAPMPAVTVTGKKLLFDTARRSGAGLAKDVAKGYVQDLYRSNMAGDVTKRRGQLYDAYVEGAMTLLLPGYDPVASSADDNEQFFFALGAAHMENMTADQRRQLMLAAVEAVRSDPTAGGTWIVTSPKNWDADDYEAAIRSPQVLRLGLTKVFHNRSSLIDAP